MKIMFKKIITIFAFVFILFSTTEVWSYSLDFDLKNAVLKSKKGGTKVYKKSDGTVITVKKKYSIAKFKDGTIIKKFKGGKREVKLANGKRIVIDDVKGTRTYYYTNGEKRTFSFKSRTPYGDLIVRIDRIIQKKPVRVSLFYDPTKSDEILDGNIKDYFNKIYSSLRSSVRKRRYTGKVPLEIAVSFCRYCQTGVCYKKKKEVIVRYLKNGKQVKQVKINYLLLNNKKNQKIFFAKLSKALQSL